MDAPQTIAMAAPAAAPEDEAVESALALPPSARPIRLHVEIVPAAAMVERHGAWQDLCERALERNVFLEPAFALPLIQHDASVARPDFALVWDEGDATTFGRLLGLCPVGRERGGIVRGLESQQTRLGTPLVDRDQAAEVVEALLDGLRRLSPRGAALKLAFVATEGAFAALLAERCARTGRTIETLDAHRRAVLVPRPGGANVTPFAQARRRKEIGRQRRRLAERGARVYTSACTPEAIARATERFLALEQRGWKGERGTALLGRPALATFTRSMARLMGFEGKCRIDAIEIDGAPVAMGIVLTVGGQAHFWKTTFHEAYAPLSPGVQFALDLTERQLADPTVVRTDSCAVPDHPMIDRLWSDRMAVADLLVQLDPAAPRRFRRVARREARVRALRNALKRLYRKVDRSVRRGR